MRENRELELYLHIPFCVRKCLYCDFLSGPAEPSVKERYLEALTREALGRAGEGEGRRVISVFFGGGTPSSVEARLVCGLLRRLREAYDVAREAEITIEINPGAAEMQKLWAYREAGFNRLSIGLQSADDRELAVLGRVHTWEQFLKTYDAARQAGFDNINVDLMSALPGQTYESYLRTLQKTLRLKPAPEHISAYSLIWEEGTPFYEMEQKGLLARASEELDLRMSHAAGRILSKAGYERYEISNYARPGYACRHNQGYWRRRDYLGFGVGAASLLDNVRFQNMGEISRYLESPLSCREQTQRLTVEEQMEEFLFLGLRLTAGVGFEDFQRRFSRSLDEIYGPVVEKNLREGLLRRYEKSDGAGGRRAYLALTERGLDVSSYVMAQFLR